MKATRYSPTILAVNDTPDVLELFTVLLEREGYRVVTAKDGVRALELAFSVEPDIIISDVVMPELDGLEFCRRLKQHPRTADVPVLLVSALRTANEDSLKGLIAGADDYLELPFRRQELLVKVARLTERHRVEKHYREIVEQAADIIYTRDMDGHLTSINEAGARFFGRPASELVGVHLGALIGKEAAAKDIADAREHPENYPTRSLHYLKDAQGVPHYLEGIITIVNEGGQPAGVRGVVRDITERKRVEEALQENEARFRGAFDYSSIGMALVYPDGRWLRVNRSICDIVGYSEEELLAIDFQTITHPDDLEKDLDYVRQMLSGEIRSYQMEKRYLHKQGHIVWVMLSVSLVRDANQRPLYFISQIQDITKRKRAEEALRDSEERYRELFANANDLIYTHDLKGNFTSLNKTGERITGYTLEEALRMNIAQVVVPEQLERAHEMIARKAAEEVSTVYELDIEAKDGRRVALELSTRLIYSEGQPVGVQGIGRDITERKRAEEALSESERRFREMLENIQLVACMLDTQGNLTFCNEYLLDSTGWEREEVIGRNWFELFVPQDQRETFENIFFEMLSHGAIPSHLENEIQTRSGERRLISWSNTLLRDAQGAVIGTTSIGQDVTERAESEQRMLASMQQLETLTALATAVKDSREADKLILGVADSITNSTDYRSCVVMLFADEHPYRPRCLSRSSNIPSEYVELICSNSYPIADMRRLIESGVRIEVGELGFAAYYPPSHYYLLDRHLPDRYKTDMSAPHPSEGPRWYAGDELLVPLVTQRGDYLGVISLDDPRSGRAPDRQSVLPVVALARQVTQLLAQQQAAEAMEQQVEREAMINRISGAVRRSLDLTEIFRTAVREIGSYLGVDRCTLFMSDEEAGLARNMAEYHAEGVQPVGRDFEIGILKDLISGIDQQGALVFDDAATDERLSHVYSRLLRTVGVRSIMYVAIKVGDETPAAFALSTTRGTRHWRKADIALATAVADQTGIAIRQAQLFQKAEATSARESLINRLSLTIRASLNLPEVLNTATRELGRALSASRVHLRLHEPGRPTSLLEHEYVAPHVRSIKHIVVSYDDPVGQRLLRSLQTIVINDALNYTGGSA
ncbi:MAG: PAS domain S-box protein, partial [Acidobacteria bacterium]|nr:PAS domain S-box protein [Acidobacteriota bacterium]